MKSLLPESIESAQAFAKILTRERARCDRNGQVFSILSYEVIDESGIERAGADFFQFLVGRVRTMDVLGWFGERHLAVLLPETPQSGAQVLALDIAEACAGGLSLPPCRIYTYPADTLPKTDPQPAPFGSPPSLGSTQPDPGAVHDPASAAAPAPATACACTADGAALGLEPWFGIPMPWWKRTMDLTLALFALVLTAPVMAIVALFIKVVSPGPILYRQDRVGHRGRIFRLYKFRTMHVGAETHGHRKYMSRLISQDIAMTKIDSAADPRLYPGARFLRKSCLDELPQFLNVLKGDMSLVGPRPCLPYEAEAFLRWHHRRFDVVPGITGLWQVKGKNKTTFKQMIRYDIEYGKEYSLLQDLKILIWTIPAVFAILFEKPEAPVEIPCDPAQAAASSAPGCSDPVEAR